MWREGHRKGGGADFAQAGFAAAAMVPRAARMEDEGRFRGRGGWPTQLRDISLGREQRLRVPSKVWN